MIDCYYMLHCYLEPGFASCFQITNSLGCIGGHLLGTFRRLEGFHQRLDRDFRPGKYSPNAEATTLSCVNTFTHKIESGRNTSSNEGGYSIRKPSLGLCFYALALILVNATLRLRYLTPAAI